MKLPRLKGKLRKPKTAKARRDLAARDFLRRQQSNEGASSYGGEGLIAITQLEPNTEMGDFN